MKKIVLKFCFAILVLTGFSCSSSGAQTTADNLLGEGRQPQISVDKAGIIRVVYGQENAIYYSTSINNGRTFSEPEVIGKIQDLLLGMSMGPQIASSGNYSVVTAIDKKGNIHSYNLNHKTDKWVRAGQVNDVPQVAAEGLISIASNDTDTFYAVWLDIRDTRKNKIVLASTRGSAEKWTPNRIVYQSPDSTVCECCKPSIAVKGKQVHLMFRNWLKGSRDFYTMHSTDGGKSFSSAQKLGAGTWVVQGCPMDGGGLLLDTENKVHTTWQRQGNVYYAQPGKPEVLVSKGRNCRISGQKQQVISWKEGNELKVKNLQTGKQQTIGKGSYLETAELPGNRTLCVWENEGKLYFKTI